MTDWRHRLTRNRIIDGNPIDWFIHLRFVSHHSTIGYLIFINIHHFQLTRQTVCVKKTNKTSQRLSPLDNKPQITRFCHQSRIDRRSCSIFTNEKRSTSDLTSRRKNMWTKARLMVLAKLASWSPRTRIVASRKQDEIGLSSSSKKDWSSVWKCFSTW